jgi:peroxiredoxin
LHERFGGKDLVVLGFDFMDDPSIAKDLLKENAATFPSIVDSSDATKAAGEEYHVGAVPTTYLIDREGKIVSGWIGYTEENDPTLDLLKKLGID